MLSRGEVMEENEIKEIADIYLIENVGNLVGPGKPHFDTEKKLWIVPIFHMSSIAYYRMGEMHVDENGKIVYMPTNEEMSKQGKETLMQLIK